jgi:hypothetical protein
MAANHCGYRPYSNSHSLILPGFQIGKYEMHQMFKGSQAHRNEKA